MKTKVAVVALALAAGMVPFAQAGPGIVVSVGTGGNFCRPAPFCPPVFFRPFPAPCYGFAPSWYSWGPTVVSYSTWPSSGFSNFSPVMNSNEGAPVYRVPPPILPSQPITVHPDSTFRWRR